VLAQTGAATMSASTGANDHCQAVGGAASLDSAGHILSGWGVRAEYWTGETRYDGDQVRAGRNGVSR
jgi:hypothetical protein